MISGEIQIEKTRDKPNNTGADLTFTFNVVKDGDEKHPIIVNVTVPTDYSVGRLNDSEREKLTNLARGSYTITEAAVNGYQLQDVISTN